MSYTDDPDLRRAQVKCLRCLGFSFREIARALGVSKTNARRDEMRPENTIRRPGRSYAGPRLSKNAREAMRRRNKRRTDPEYLKKERAATSAWHRAKKIKDDEWYARRITQQQSREKKVMTREEKDRLNETRRFKQVANESWRINRRAVKRARLLNLPLAVCLEYEVNNDALLEFRKELDLWRHEYGAKDHRD